MSLRPLIFTLFARLAAAGVCCVGWGPVYAEDSNVTCETRSDEIVCDVDVRPFLQDEIRSALSSGWENEIHIRLFLLDDDDEIIGLTYAKLNQRCYLDFFEEECLALWEGNDDWDSYPDVDELIDGIGNIRLRSVRTSSLAPGTYQARVLLELNPLTDEQISQVRSWLARNRGGHLVMDQSDSSIFGTFVSIFANVRPGDAEAVLSIDAPALDVLE